MPEVTFYGVRGSCAVDSPHTARYGGNTSCVVVSVPGEAPILLDLGSGVRNFGSTVPPKSDFEATVLLSHLHFDHVQGLPFFTPMLESQSQLDVYGPRQEDGSLEWAVRGLVRPPYFPVTLDSFPGQFRFHDVTDETIEIGSAKVIVKPVPHLGPTVGYRIEWDEAVIAYVSDHQEPEANPQEVNDDVLALCHEADLVIHDAQFTRAEFLERSHWGHSTIDYAVRVAAKAGAKRLALFHHDPSHTDDDIDEMSSAARVAGASAGLSEVFAAREGLRIRLGE